MDVMYVNLWIEGDVLRLLRRSEVLKVSKMFSDRFAYTVITKLFDANI